MGACLCLVVWSLMTELVGFVSTDREFRTVYVDIPDDVSGDG